MGKPTLCICENEDADQRLCFPYMDCTIPLFYESEISCTAWFVSDQVGNQNVGFLFTRLILIVSSVPVSTSNLPLPGMDPEKLLVLASGIETHKLESAGASRKKRGV